VKKLYTGLGERGAPQVSLWRAGLHLGALSSFAIAWQYFEPLSDSGELFIEHGFSGPDVVLFALAMVFLPPALLLAIEALAGLVSLRVRNGLHLAFVGGFASLIAWQALFGATPDMAAALIYPLALLAGILGAAAYWWLPPARLWLTVLSIGPAVVLVLFLGLSPIRVIAFDGDGPAPVSDVEARAPVVMIVLDEFPVTSLMGRAGRIDSVRYPNFASLARDGTWYRNAATVGDYTKIAVPAILTGTTPTPQVLPVADKHPNNLFRLLGGSYHLEVMEWLTRLCGKETCPDQDAPSVIHDLRSLLGDVEVAKIPALPRGLSFRIAGGVRPERNGGGNVAPAPSDSSVRRSPNLEQEDRLDYFVKTLGAGQSRTLNFLHLLLPHHAWVRLPSGQRYVNEGSPFVLHPAGRWPDDPDFTAVAYQRHLFQVAYVDRLIGRVIDRLKTLGTYDSSLVIVTADHGVSFRPGESTRTATRDNIGDIAPVPLFVKAPGQTDGRIDDAHVESTDILATAAKELGIALPWRTSGAPADEVGQERTILRMQRETEGTPMEVGREALAAQRDETVRRKLALFGSGGAQGSMYALGGRRELIGRQVAGLPAGPSSSARATVSSAGRYRAVDPEAVEVPAEVNGTIRNDEPERRRIAVAVNGRIAATAWTLRFGELEYYSAVCPPGAFRRGRNRVELYELTGPPRAARVAPLS